MTRTKLFITAKKNRFNRPSMKASFKSTYNIHFASHNVLRHCRPQTNTNYQLKSFFISTCSTSVSRQVTRNISFCSTNTLLSFSTSWNSTWITNETYYIAPIINFLAENLLLLSYHSIRYSWSRTWKDQNVGMKRRLNALLSFYLEFSQRTLYPFHMYIHFQKNWHDDTRYNLYLTFTANRLFINMVSKGGLRYNFFSLSVGLFLKFLNGKKSLKKNKLIKLLLMRYVRKLFIVSEIRDLVIFTKRTPVFFTELCNSLISPVIRPFLNPFTNSMYDDTKLNSIKPKLRIKQIRFYQPKSFGSMKGKQKGRLKRKITRRIIRTNRVCD
jgi:hypothetical protein